MTEKQLQELKEKRDALTKERNALAVGVDTQAMAIIEERDAISKMNADDPDVQNKKEALEKMLEKQKKEREVVLNFDELIDNVSPMGILAAKSVDDLAGNDPNKPLTENIAQAFMSGVMANGHQKRDFFEHIGTDIFNYMQKSGLNRNSIVKSRSRYNDKVMLGGDTADFNIAGTFTAVLGENPMARKDAMKSWGEDAPESSYNFGKDEDINKVLEKHRQQKSMFLQDPNFAGGDGSLYDPTTPFAGNDGGLCEYDIDPDIAVLPYPTVNFMDALPVEQINKIRRLFVRQAIRVNNANTSNETIYSPPIDYIVRAPESQFGFVQDEAYTVVFEDSQPISEEMTEECPTIVDIVRNQLMRNPWEKAYDQILYGNGGDGEHPELIGFFNTAGVSTRIHQGAASYNGVPQGAGVGTDTGRDTIERMIFDSEAFGYTPDAALISHDDYVDMSMKKDLDGRKLYTPEQLNKIRNTPVKYDVRITAGEAGVCPFRQVTKVLMRRMVQFDIGWINSMFVEAMMMMRVRMRLGNMMKQPFAFIRGSALDFS